jgi:hypothetical protein
VAPWDLRGASWLDGGAQEASERLGDGGRLGSKRRQVLVL